MARDIAISLVASGEIDGYLQIVAAFAEHHPRAVSASPATLLAEIGEGTPTLTMSDDDGKRIVVWIQRRLAPELIGWARGVIDAIARRQPALLLPLPASVVDESMRMAARDAVREALAGAFRLMENEQRFVELETQARRALVHDPDAGAYMSCLISALNAQGRFPEARQLGAEWLVTQTDPRVARALALALAHDGETAAALDLLEKHAEWMRGTRNSIPLIEAAIESATRARSLDPTLERLGRWLDFPDEILRELPFLAPIAAEIARWAVRVGEFPRAVRYCQVAVARGLPLDQVRADPELRPLQGFPSFDRFMQSLESLEALADLGDDPEEGD